MLQLANGTTIPTSETRGATHPTDELITLRNGRTFRIGAVTRLDTPCPKCEAEGRKTVGGYTPRLNRRIDDGFVGCVTHDGQRLTGAVEIK